MAKDTKDKLLDTAHDLFQKKGFDGVTMREIAGEAKVNKGLLHYYFKSKQAIFIGVFKIVSKLIYVNLAEILKRTDIDFEQKIDLMVNSYFEMLTKHPRMPLFVLSELSKHPDFAEGSQLGSTLGEAVGLIENCLTDVKPNRTKEPGDGFHFLMNMVSLCVFPFMAVPITKAIRPEFYKTDAQFIESRKKHVKQILKISYK